MADVENAGPNNIPRAPRAFAQKIRWSSQLKGALVEVSFKDLDKVQGYVRWVGTPDFAAGKKFIGVELHEPLGTPPPPLSLHQIIITTINFVHFHFLLHFFFT